MIKDGCILEITDSLSVQTTTPSTKFIQTTLTNLPKPIQVQSKDRRACRCGGDSYVLKKIVKNPGLNNGNNLNSLLLVFIFFVRNTILTILLTLR